MPRETKAFLCDFKCGARPMVRKRNMEGHESRCALNPGRRTCKTCMHDREEIEAPGGFYCEIEKKPETIPDGFGGQKKVGLMYDCPHWEAKEGDKK